MKRYGLDYWGVAAEDASGPWVKYDEANDLLQDERDKLARIDKVMRLAFCNWPGKNLQSAVQTVLQICQDGKASPITEGQSSE